MFKQWISNIVANPATAEANHPTLDFQRASTQLLLEVACADFQIDDVERQAIITAIDQSSELGREELNEIVASAEQQVETAISYYEHVRLINTTFSKEQKILLIEQMWRVAYADNELDRYEEAFIRKVADLIYVKHRDFIQAKLRVLER